MNIKGFVSFTLGYLLLLSPSVLAAPDFQSRIDPIPISLQQKMQQYTWHPGCPVSMQNLNKLTLTYWGFDQEPHIGVLIVNKKVAHNVVVIFQQLFANKFPIAKMQPVEAYEGDDDLSMQDNNTSAYNCRSLPKNSRVFSLHSYGLAIDINPRLNPDIEGNHIKPYEAREYLNRNHALPGMILAEDPITQIFTQAGWQWGGYWHSKKDYQHFEFSK